MGVSPRLGIPLHVERFAHRRQGHLVALSLAVALLCSGCRSSGPWPNFFASANSDLTPTSKRSKPINSIDNGDLEQIEAKARRRADRNSLAAKDRDKPKYIATADAHDDDEIESVVTVARTPRQTIKAAFDDADPISVEEESPLLSLIESAAFQETSTSATRNGKNSLSRYRADTQEPMRVPTIEIPKEIPGAGAPRIQLPPRILDDTPEGRAEKLAAIEILFPALPDQKLIDLPQDRVMTLDQFEAIALDYNPLIAQAQANITILEGAAIQAGIYPNPILGHEADTVGSSFTRDYQGIFASQLIKTAGKLPLQRDIANMDLMNVQLAYQRTRNEILHTVRTNYYNVLISYESIRYNSAMVRLTHQVYDGMRERLKGGVQPFHDLSQYMTLVKQAEVASVQAQNQYIASWKQLAASVGIPGLRPAKLEGNANMQVPNFDYDTLLSRVTTVHPDLHAAKNLETQAQRNLQLQRAIPIPDVTVAAAFQNDFTTPTYPRTSYNLNISVPVPIFDRNQGNIKSAHGRVKFSSSQYSVKTNELTTLLADAVNRFQTARYTVQNYQGNVLPNMVRAYVNIYESYLSENPDLAFGDIIVAQQNLSTGIGVYVTSLSAQWSAIFDIGNLLQIDDIHELLPDLPHSTVEPTVVVPSPTGEEGGRP